MKQRLETIRDGFDVVVHHVDPDDPHAKPYPQYLLFTAHRYFFGLHSHLADKNLETVFLFTDGDPDADVHQRISEFVKPEDPLYCLSTKIAMHFEKPYQLPPKGENVYRVAMIDYREGFEPEPKEFKAFCLEIGQQLNLDLLVLAYKPLCFETATDRRLAAIEEKMDLVLTKLDRLLEPKIDTQFLELRSMLQKQGAAVIDIGKTVTEINRDMDLTKERIEEADESFKLLKEAVIEDIPRKLNELNREIGDVYSSISNLDR